MLLNLGNLRLFVFFFIFSLFFSINSFKVLADTNSNYDLYEISDQNKQEEVELNKDYEQSFFEMSKSIMFWNLLAFVLLVFSLKSYAYPKIIDFIDDRKRKVLEDIENAKVLRIESDKLFLQNKNTLEETLVKKSVLLREANEKANLLKQESLNQAALEIEKMKEQFSKEMKLREIQSMEKMKENISRVIFDLTNQFIKSKLTEDEDIKSIKDTLDKYLKKV